ncbi:MAG: hypothetical protein AUK12_04845 [Candidatus Levybacteria bacterium CG2_30_37_29]|nr:MAG: hypothetical protein AUK12_04845 [Candidatus Levybacteria bacterium CG2_30_37_29]PIR79334.1 MAG: hypothetical protein COU26_01705 [Candidatus Levybacteria bacterium CG10_big_fil_rev_8_21_14_0_10_36_30]
MMNEKNNLSGLTEKEAKELLEKYGENSIKYSRKTSFLQLLFSQYKNIITLVLVFASLFSFASGELIDGFFILLVLLVNGLFGFFQEFRAEKTIEKLQEFLLPKAIAIRDAKEVEIWAHEIVPGDIIVLREGDRIPADGKLLSNVMLEVDEAVLTGESLPSEKMKNSSLYSGTFVVRGRGYFKVEETGISSKIGKIAEELEKIKKPKIPLSENLSNLGKKITLLAVSFALILLVVGIIQGREIKEIILTVISLSVALIPEGLPLVVTIALAVGAHRMARRKAIVRKMAAIETLGATTVILSDKTGTITQNKMKVKRHWIYDEKLPLFLRGCVLGNTASLILKEDNGELEIVGDKTDGALLVFAKNQVNDIEEYRNEGRIINEKPFNPETKTIEVTWEAKNQKHVFVRGAPESILKIITNKKEKEELEKEINRFAEEGLRVIGFAQKKDSSEFSLLGILGIYDPPRNEAKEAIEKARTAGIRVVMVTGDNPLTAKKISEEIGLISEGELVVTSDEISKMTDEEFLKILPRVRVFARMLPEDKLRLLRIYKRSGEVVAVTGDGVNDALALSEAHIGVAMGETGTDVAKEAADVVITDDNLYTIVHAVEEGRGIYDNLIKVVVFLISSNFTEFLIVFVGIMIGLPIPLTPTQILWVNLVGDGLPAMVLAIDTKRKNLLFNKPRDIKEQILNKQRVIRVFQIIIPFLLFLIILYIFALSKFDHSTSRMILFNALVFGEMIIVFLIRGGIRPLNKFLILAVFASLFLQVLINVVPFLRAVFS